jgi:dienelactone hydrolase
MIVCASQGTGRRCDRDHPIGVSEQMQQALRPALRSWIPLLAMVLLVGCSDDDNGVNIQGPDLPIGPGRIYDVESVFFPTIDGVSIAASYGRVPGVSSRGAVMLVHEVGVAAAHQEWLSSGVFEALLENGYDVLALDLRGHGGSSLPADGRTQDVLLVEDLEAMHLDVRGAVTWLRAQPQVDNARIAVIGNGVGGNVAYVSMGAFPDDLQAGVALSPGFWDTDDLSFLVVGAGIAPFAPHDMLYLVGENDEVSINDTQSLSFSGFASALASLTADPSLVQFEGVSNHGLELLQSPVTLQLILEWLQTHL